MQSSLSFGLLETGRSPRGSGLHCTGGDATPRENEERNVGLVQWGRRSATSHCSSQLGGGFNPPIPLPAAGRSFHSSHLYSVCVNVVGCLVLLSTRFVNCLCHVLIRLLQNPICKLPKMSHVCRRGCLQAASLCTEVRSCAGSMGEDHPVQHNYVFIKENALVEQGGASRLSISFQVKFNGFIVTPKALHASLAATGGCPPVKYIPPCICRVFEAAHWKGDTPEGLGALERDPLCISGSPTFLHLWHSLICLVLDPAICKTFPVCQILHWEKELHYSYIVSKLWVNCSHRHMTSSSLSSQLHALARLDL